MLKQTTERYKIQFLMPIIMNFPHRSRHIVYNLCSQSFLRRTRSRRENLQSEEYVWVKPGRGIKPQEIALSFETPFFDGAQGIIAMILALQAGTMLFSRRVIDIKNMLLHIMTVDKKTTTTKKTKHNTKDGQTLSTAPW